jgi:hypothetical protein
MLNAMAMRLLQKFVARHVVKPAFRDRALKLHDIPPFGISLSCSYGVLLQHLEKINYKGILVSSESIPLFFFANLQASIRICYQLRK